MNNTTPSMTKRMSVFLYGVLSYAIFFGTFCYAAGFVGNFLVPKSMDSPASMPLLTALAVNFGLLGIFAVQHSVMARPFFKRWITQHIPEAAERSTYTLLSSLALILLFALWQPMGSVIWNVQNAAGRTALHAGFAFGWLLVLVTTFLINHFDLFGLRQVWFYLRGKTYRPLKFVTPGPYKLIRHPLYLGWFCAFWFTPTMTAAHLFFAVVTTTYILVAIRLEERDLVAAHGDDYIEYRRRTPMIVPSFNARDAGTGRTAQRTEEISRRLAA